VIKEKIQKKAKNAPSKFEGRVARNDLSQLVSMVAAAQQPSSLTSRNQILQTNIYAPLTLDWMTLTYLFCSHGILQTAAEVPVLDALRGGVILESKEMDADDVAALLEHMEEKGDYDVIEEILIWGRLFGGSVGIVSVPNQDPASPFLPRNLEGLKFHVANRWELGGNYRAKDVKDLIQTPMERYNSANSSAFNFYGVTVDHTRILQFIGKKAPHFVRWQLQGWGMSEYDRMVIDFNSYIRTKDVLYELLEEAKVDVFKIENLASSLGTSDGTTLIFNRLQRANELKRYNRALVLDKLDEYEQKQITFSGLAEVMKENRIGIAAALRMPMTKLFGLSASGFNSGEDDIENYNSMVESAIRSKAKPLIRQLVQLRCIELFGDEMQFRLKFEPLRELSAVDEETVKTAKQNRFLQLYDRMLASSKEVGEALEKEKLVSVELEATKGLLEDHPLPPQTGVEPGSEGGGKGGGKEPPKGAAGG
jgi:phage-related protein (TIGR01555 family)